MHLLRSIQSLRAFAALSVVVFHAGQLSGHPAVIGAAGVDVFFVISGFIMESAAGRTVTAGRFFVHRLIRIVPLYWAVTLAMAVLSFVPGAFPHLRAPPGHVALSLLFMPHADPAGDSFPVLVAGWTLNFEMAFYAVFAASLWLPPRRRLLALTAVLMGAVAAGLVFRPRMVAAQAWSDPILLEFLAGVWLAASRVPSRPWSGLMLATGVAAFGLQAGWPAAEAGWRLLCWGVPACLIVAGSVALEGGWPEGVVARVGDASYSIYLMHGFAVSACWRAMPGSPPALFFAASVAGSVALGAVCFVGFERPVTRVLRGCLALGKAAAAALA